MKDNVSIFDSIHGNNQYIFHRTTIFSRSSFYCFDDRQTIIDLWSILLLLLANFQTKLSENKQIHITLDMQ